MPDAPSIAVTRSQQPRRHNAPIRPRRRPATTVPDLLIALGTAGWAMGGVFLAASIGSNELTAGEAGRAIARLFAAALALAGTFTFALGWGLLRGERSDPDHYVVPMLVGAVIGVSEAGLFLATAASLLPLPFLLLVFATRPVRRFLRRRLLPARGASR